MIQIAIDAMGGDFAPRPVVDGALAAARHFDLGVMLVGPRDRLEAALGRHPFADRSRVTIVDAPDVVGMDESPSAALRRKPGASIRVAADLVARGEASALFSAGHTGATVMAAHGAFGMLPGVGSSGAGRHDPDADGRAGHAARRRRERRVPARAPAAVRRHGQRIRAPGLRPRAAARRAALDRRGGDQGQRADARGASAAQGRRRSPSSATSRRATSTAGAPT